MTSNLTFYTENSQGNIHDDSGRENMSVDGSPSFRLSKLKTLQKFIKHTPVDMSGLPHNNTDVIMKEAAVAENNSRKTEYTKYTSFQREMYIHKASEKIMTCNKNYSLKKKKKIQLWWWSSPTLQFFPNLEL